MTCQTCGDTITKEKGVWIDSTGGDCCPAHGDNRDHIPFTAMHPAQSWRDGYSDGANGKPYGHSWQYSGDSELLYSDGYAVGSVKRHSAGIRTP